MLDSLYRKTGGKASSKAKLLREKRTFLQSKVRFSLLYFFCASNPVIPDKIKNPPNSFRSNVCGRYRASALPTHAPKKPVGTNNKTSPQRGGVRLACTASAAPAQSTKKIRLTPCAVCCGIPCTSVRKTTRRPALPTPIPESSAAKKLTSDKRNISRHHKNTGNQHNGGENTPQNPCGDAGKQQRAHRTAKRACKCGG